MERHEEAASSHEPERRLRRQRLVIAGVLLLATFIASVAVPGLGVLACVGKPERDEQRDQWLEESLRAVRLRNPRLRQPDPQEWAVVEQPEFRSALETEAGETVRYWLEQLVEGDDLTALARHDQLFAAGARGFRVCVDWLKAHRAGTTLPLPSRRVRRSDPPHVASQREGEAVQRVLALCRALLREEAQAPGTLPANERSRLAAVVAEMLADEHAPLSRTPRRTAYEVLALCYTAEEAPVLATGLGEQNGVTQVVVAQALREFRVPLEEDVGRAAWSAMPAAARRVLRLEQNGAWLVLSGPFPLSERTALREASEAESWRNAVATLEARWCAAFAATPALIEMLSHRSLSARSRAAECLRGITGAFERYRAQADPLTRQRATIRWSHRVFEMNQWLQDTLEH